MTQEDKILIGKAIAQINKSITNDIVSQQIIIPTYCNFTAN